MRVEPPHNLTIAHIRDDLYGPPVFRPSARQLVHINLLAPPRPCLTWWDPSLVLRGLCEAVKWDAWPSLVLLCQAPPEVEPTATPEPAAPPSAPPVEVRYAAPPIAPGLVGHLLDVFA